MGTKESIWFDLIDVIENPNLNVEETKLQELLFNNSFNSKTDESQIKPEHLTDWQGVLNSRLTNTKMICRLVGDASTTISQELIFNSLNEVIQKGDEIVFDVTHGLRSQPIITTFILMYLRYLKEIKIENIRFYYASLDSTKKIGTVHNLDFCNELMKATEAVAIFEQTGNYEQIGKNLNLSPQFNANLEKLAFLDEVNRTNPQIPNELNKEIAKASFSPLKRSLADKFEKPIRWASKENLSNQLREKAVFAFEGKQYYKAILILLEAVIVAYGECCGDSQISENQELHFYRDKAEKQMLGQENGTPTGLNAQEIQSLKNLKKLRNAIAHGTDANGIEPEAILAREAIDDEKKLRQAYSDGNTLFSKIIKGEIGK